VTGYYWVRQELGGLGGCVEEMCLFLLFLWQAGEQGNWD
jgi:hypothetical protein